MITSVPACKAFRDIPSDNTEHDAELERLIGAVTEWLDGQCGRIFESATVTEYHNGEEWRDRLLVARPPLSTITNIWDDPLRVYGTALLTTQYVIEDANAGLIRLDGIKFQQGIRNIKITYTGGYTTIPSDLEQAAIEMVWAARSKGENNLVGVRSRSIADGNVQFVNLGWGSLAQEIIVKYSLLTGVH